MNVEIKFPNTDAQGRVFLTWRPVTCTVRLIQPPAGTTGQVKVRFTSVTTGNGGRLLFYANAGQSGSTSIDLDLPATGTTVDLTVGGAFQSPSSRYGDIAIEARELNPTTLQPTQGAPLLKFATMVRIRKNANALSASERDRFVSALATLNGQGAGIFKQFRDTHVAGASDQQAHSGPGFLPWHRAYLLDLERELQNVDATVALPYWRFDQAAPNVITGAFMGVPNSNGTVTFTSGHPFLSWVTDGQVGVFRGPGVTASNIPQPQIPGFVVRTEAQTLALSSNPGANFAAFRTMQGSPHGAAHMANWSGPITMIPNAARDPLFFLLHCNVDRLWAKWQWLNKLHDPTKAASFDPSATLKGHRLNDTIWPWDNDTSPPRPNFAPRTPLPASTMTAAPGPKPKIKDMVDYLAVHGGADHAFAYDDVPYQP